VVAGDAPDCGLYPHQTLDLSHGRRTSIIQRVVAPGRGPENPVASVGPGAKAVFPGTALVCRQRPLRGPVFPVSAGVVGFYRSAGWNPNGGRGLAELPGPEER